MPSRAIATGTISFGLVSIPVKLYTATSPEGISFHLLHKKCKGRIKQQIFCPTDNEVVERGDLVKGYEYAKDQYALFTEEELTLLESPKTDSIEIVQFVRAESVDWIYIARTYYLGPDKGGDKAYALLSHAMERGGKIAVARYFSRGKDQLVLLRPYQAGLVLHYAYYANEVRPWGEVDRGASVAATPVENELADKLIDQLTGAEFRPESYRDGYTDRVTAAAQKKVEGQEIASLSERPSAPIIDLFEALKQSLAGATTAPEEARPAAPGPGAERRDGPRARPPRKAAAPAAPNAAKRRAG